MNPRDAIRTQRLTKQAIAGFTLAALVLAAGLSIPTARWRTCKDAPNRSADLRGFCRAL
jgi:hypothetical protein